MNVTSYETFRNSLVMTLPECTEYYSPQLIAAVIGLIIFAGLVFYYLFKLSNITRFIKEEKLQKKYQEWKTENKGLNI